MSVGKHLDVKIYPCHEEQEIQLSGGDITPRGMVIHCSPEQLNLLHQMEEPQQAKFESVRLKIELHFSAGDGVVIIKAQQYRTQEQNRADALERLSELIVSAAKVEKKRRPTKPTLGSKTRRLESKSKRGSIKAGRGKVDF